MNSQDYFNESVEYLKDIINIRNQQMMDLDNVFKNKNAQTEQDVIDIIKNGNLSDEELDKYYNTSQLQVDLDILCKKICDFVYFNKIIGNEIVLDNIQELNGFAYFMKEYVPYKTTFILTPEKTTKESNTEEYERNKEVFKKTILNKDIIKYINENRNQNSSGGI